jgi:hypothetical protein
MLSPLLVALCFLRVTYAGIGVDECGGAPASGMNTIAAARKNHTPEF